MQEQEQIEVKEYNAEQDGHKSKEKHRFKKESSTSFDNPLSAKEEELENEGEVSFQLTSPQIQFPPHRVLPLRHPINFQVVKNSDEEEKYTSGEIAANTNREEMECIYL